MSRRAKVAVAAAAALALVAPLALWLSTTSSRTPAAPTGSAEQSAAVLELGRASPNLGEFAPETSTASPTPTASAVDESTQAIDAILSRRGSAITQGSAQLVLADTDASNRSFIASQVMLANNADRLPIGGWSYQATGEPLTDADAGARVDHALLGPGAVVRQVTLRYRLAGYDSGWVTTERRMAFVQRQGRWVLASDVDTSGIGELWDVAPLKVVKGKRSLVLMASSEFSGKALARQADSAIAGVSSVWGTDWPQRVVLLVPQSNAQLAKVLHREAHAYDQLAAVTTGERARSDSGGPTNRVWLVPGSIPKLTALGRQIVLRHEFTHVATGAAVPGDFPIWLAEGFADYIGYRGSGVSESTAARELMRDVRAGRLPKRLPVKADFDGSNPKLSQAYQGAWLACRLIADRYGESALVDVYRTALAQPEPSTSADVALNEVLGISTSELVADWRASLRRDAGR